MKKLLDELMDKLEALEAEEIHERFLITVERIKLEFEGIMEEPELTSNMKVRFIIEWEAPYITCLDELWELEGSFLIEWNQLKWLKS